MSRFKQHFFVCTNTRPPFAGASCGPQGSPNLVMHMMELLEKHGVAERVKVTPCGCLGPCDAGPMMVVYPEAVWYAHVTPEDIEEMVTSHVLRGEPVQRLVYAWEENPA